ncbi:TIGR04388 family protein, partial [Leptospira kmetyi]|uniref:TIGR04388 family protein n=1 Tax=Leptospira kmetyi TaxID=408139 RepID=UPI001AEFEF48
MTGADSPFSGKRVEATSHLLAYQTYTSNKTLSPKAAQTIVGDIGHELGLVSDNQLDALYKDSKSWLNSVTADDLKAKTQEGIVSMHDFQKNSAREMMFDEIGKILSPALGDVDPHQVGQLLKYYQDKKTAKEAAKDQKLK